MMCVCLLHVCMCSELLYSYTYNRKCKEALYFYDSHQFPYDKYFWNDNTTFCPTTSVRRNLGISEMV